VLFVEIVWEAQSWSFVVPIATNQWIEICDLLEPRAFLNWGHFKWVRLHTVWCERNVVGRWKQVKTQETSNHAWLTGVICWNCLECHWIPFRHYLLIRFLAWVWIRVFGYVSCWVWSVLFVDVLLTITLEAYLVRVQVVGSHHAQGFFAGRVISLTSLHLVKPSSHSSQGWYIIAISMFLSVRVLVGLNLFLSLSHPVTRFSAIIYIVSTSEACSGQRFLSCLPSLRIALRKISLARI